MSRDQVEVIREVLDAFNAGGGEALIPYGDPAIEWHTTGRFADQGAYRGHEGVRSLFRELREDLEDLGAQVGDLRELAGGQVTATVTVTGRGRREGECRSSSTWRSCFG